MQRCVVAWLVLALLGSSELWGQETVTFSGRQWTLSGDSRIEQFRGREALRFGSGRAILEGARFQDGTIEFDFAATGHRAFAGVFFRIQDGARDGEYVYLRPHQTNRFDALQYTPVDSAITAWQLYPEYNSAAVIPTSGWVHVRLEVFGDSLTVFVGHTATPTLSARLQRGVVTGGIHLRGFAPRGESLDAPEGTMPTAFANIVVTPRAPGLGTASHSSPARPADRFIREWALSPAVGVSAMPATTIPKELEEHSHWSVAVTDDQGRLNISRYRAVPVGADFGLVLARVVIRSERAQWKAMHFGFSDAVTIFLNDQPLYSADNRYLSRSGRYLGVMTLENDVLHLPLERGDNDLVFAVGEWFGGWGLIARFDDLDGVSLSQLPSHPR